MNKCVGCKWCEIPASPLLKLIETEYFCNHPDTLGGENKITGKRSRPSCVRQRMEGGKCGPEGVLWEQK